MEANNQQIQQTIKLNNLNQMNIVDQSNKNDQEDQNEIKKNFLNQLQMDYFIVDHHFLKRIIGKFLFLFMILILFFILKNNIYLNQKENNYLLNSSQQKINSNKQNVGNSTQLIPNYRIRQTFRNNCPKPHSTDQYELSHSSKRLIQLARLQCTFRQDDYYVRISRTSYLRSIKLLQLVHNVDINGNFVLQNHNYYKSFDEKYNTLKSLVDQQKDYFTKTYFLHRYNHNQLRMCVYVSSYNNAQKNRLYLRNLDSIFQQQYSNYHIVYVDDGSTDGTGDFVKKYMIENEIPPQKYTILKNQKREGNCYNAYNVAHNFCQLGQIFVVVDGDDALIGRQVFSTLNALYQRRKIALTWGHKLTIGNYWLLQPLMNGFAPRRFYQNQPIRNYNRFATGHLKTMYVDLFRMIQMQDLKDKRGNFYRFATDVAFMTPAVQLAGKFKYFLQEVIYEEHRNTGININIKFRKKFIAEIFRKRPYKPLEKLDFLNNPITTKY